MNNENSLITNVLHSDRKLEIDTRPIQYPIHATLHYAFDKVEDLIATFQSKPGYAYSRQGTPTTTALETKINAMEEGVGTVCCSSGMAAITGVFLTLLKAGDHFICSHYIFGNTNSFFSTLMRFGVEVTFVDTTRVDDLEAALRPNTKLVFSESIANPMTQVSDLKGIGDFCEKHGLIFFLDNTMLTPVVLKGSDVKASLVMHSLSKSMGGHANALGGSITDTGLYDWSNYPNIHERYRKGDSKKWAITQIKKKYLRDMGATLSADSAHKISVGLETVELRVKRAHENALGLAKYLEQSPYFKNVKYPGLKSHAQHELASSLTGGNAYGFLISAELSENLDMKTVLNNFKTIILASHLGDNRTLCIPVAQTIFYEMSQETLNNMNISHNTLRFSVGIELLLDIIKDIEQAVEAH
ncbi:Cys/Met metabolism PLP-dependent enzyme [Taylorella asinigenitalis 14/45]|uniref:Cys/Met metabolism PLP-dependent enzyme n=1 Tax=Taylorella asinigenitalis 14/45 TaxID=1091495 RepID=I7IK78_9BURK|nr:cystathionine gamma-synthase family protein [Taylorella asinigenitalis]CCG18951.1 Cys/Met metabolism PLP-dependent enzyme [Taylorella asinigenitalis 14/45]